jgi:hypothetical protein
MKWKIKLKACNVDEVSFKRQNRLLSFGSEEAVSTTYSKRVYCRQILHVSMLIAASRCDRTKYESQDVERDLLGSGMERGGGRISGPWSVEA